MRRDDVSSALSTDPVAIEKGKLVKNPVIKMAVTALMVVGLASPALADEGYTLPSSGASGILGNVEQWLTQLVSFVTGPAAVAIAVLAFIGAAALWVFAPRGGAIGVALRAVAATIVVFNLTAITVWLTA